jgi:RsmE family RNA methyltransferase
MKKFEPSDIMNTLLLSPKDILETGLYCIKDKFRMDHIKNVLKLKVGDSLKVCFINKGTGKGSLLSIENDLIKIKTPVDQFLKMQEPWCDLFIGLSRPQTCKKILELGTSLGANSFEFFGADLSEKSYAQSKLFKNQAYDEFILKGLSQSATLYKKPSLTLSPIINLKNYENKSQKIVLSPYTKNKLNHLNINFSQPLLIAIGPERGWSKNELKNFNNQEFLEVSLSSSILRVEAATIAILSQLELLKNSH